MKTPLTLLATALFSFASLAAEIPQPVLAQLRADVRAAISGGGATPTDEQVAEIMGQLSKDAAAKETFSFTPAEIEAFNTGNPVPSDADLAKEIASIRKSVGQTPLPSIIAFYERLRAAGKLTPKQKIVFQRLCKSLSASLAKRGGKK